MSNPVTAAELDEAIARSQEPHPNQIADQAATHGIGEDRVVEEIMFTEPAIERA